MTPLHRTAVAGLGAALVAGCLLVGVRPSAARPRPVRPGRPASAARPVRPGRPDPRPAALRRELALHPAARRAVWIDLDPRLALARKPVPLSAQERARRARLGVGTLATDRPIEPTAVGRLRRAGAHIRVVANGIRSVSADVDSATAERLARLPEVVGMQPVLRLSAYALPRDPVLAPGAAARTFAADTFYGLNFGALQQLNIPAAHALGYTGRGIKIGMLDAGFDRSHEALAPVSVQPSDQFDFIWNDTVVSNQPRDTIAYNQAFHGTATLSILGGKKVGTLMGAAYDAAFALAKVEVANPTTDSHQDEDRWVAGAEFLLGRGVDIISSSLGYRYDFPDGNYPCSAMNGHTTKTSIEAQRIARAGVLLVNAIGNEGARVDSTTHTHACTLIAPADADSIIAVGGVDSLGVVASFSSHGPTPDGRTKPDLAARAVRVSFAVSGTHSQYSAGNGTSFATPLIAGSAALVMQAWRAFGVPLTAAGVRQALVLSTSKRSPDNDVGWGLPDVASAILFPQGLVIGLVSPKDAINQIASVSPTFTWVAPLVAPLQPIQYRLDVATDSVFQQIVYTDTVSDALQLTARQPLRPTNSLWWRVTATKGANIRRRTVAAGPFVLPIWVRLIDLNEPGGSQTDSVRPTLHWTALDVSSALGPMRFDMQILDENDAPIPGETVTNLTVDSAKVPLPLRFNGSYRWRVIARVDGVVDTVTSLGRFTVNSGLNPPSTSLYQNFPNPFPRTDLGVTATRIWFDLTEESQVELGIYDMRGRLVRHLIPAPGCPAQILKPNAYGRGTSSDPCVQTTWDGTDDHGRAMPRGVYLLRLRADGSTQIRHIIYTP